MVEFILKNDVAGTSTANWFLTFSPAIRENHSRSSHRNFLQLGVYLQIPHEMIQMTQTLSYTTQKNKKLI